MPLHEPRHLGRSRLLPRQPKVVGQRRRCDARLVEPRPHWRMAPSPRRRTDQVHGRSEGRRLFRPARRHDGHQWRHGFVFDEPIYDQPDRTVPRAHVPRMHGGPDHQARRQARDLGTRIHGQGVQREALQGLHARRRRTTRRSAHVALLRKGAGARRHAHDPHGHVVRRAPAEQEHPPGHPRSSDDRLPGSPRHLLPHGVAPHRRADRVVRQAQESVHEHVGHHRLVPALAVSRLPRDWHSAPVVRPEQDRDGPRPAVRRHEARRRLGPHPADPGRNARAVRLPRDHLGHAQGVPR